MGQKPFTKQSTILSFLILIIIFVTVSKAGAQWVQTSGPSSSGPITSVASSGPNLYAGTDTGLYISTDNGASWSVASSLMANDSIAAIAVVGVDIIVGTAYNGIYVSKNNGTTWASSNTGLTNRYVQCLAVSGTNVFAGTLAGLFLSTNTGASWSRVGADLAGLWIDCIAVNGSNLLAATYDYFQNYNAFYRSTNNGVNWTEIAASSGMPDNTYIESLVQSGTNVFAGTFYPGVHLSNGVYLSKDSGLNWLQVNNGLPTDLFNIVTLAASGINIFTSTLDTNFNPDLFLTTDNGANWTSVYDGLSDLVECLGVSDTNLLAGTYMTGVWSRPLSQMIASSAVETALPASQSITAYPNPFSQSSTITFSCAESGVGEVIIVNLLGSPVARLFSGELSAGVHSFEWEVSGAVAGVYECILRVGGQIQQISILHY